MKRIPVELGSLLLFSLLVGGALVAVHNYKPHEERVVYVFNLDDIDTTCYDWDDQGNGICIHRPNPPYFVDYSLR